MYRGIILLLIAGWEFSWHYIKWNSNDFIEEQIGIFEIVGVGKNTIHLLQEGKEMKDRISIYKKAFKVIKYLD